MRGSRVRRRHNNDNDGAVVSSNPGPGNHSSRVSRPRREAAAKRKHNFEHSYAEEAIDYRGKPLNEDSDEDKI